MEITAEQFNRIEAYLQVQRGNVSLSNLQVVNAILYVAENGCKWRALPKRFGNGHTIYTRVNRWAKAGVLDRLFEEMQHHQLVRIKIEAVSLDIWIVKVHPDGTGALKKRSASNRPIARRMDYQNSYGCRGCTERHLVLPDAGPSGRRARRPRAAAHADGSAATLPLTHGPSL